MLTNSLEVTVEGRHHVRIEALAAAGENEGAPPHRHGRFVDPQMRASNTSASAIRRAERGWRLCRASAAAAVPLLVVQRAILFG